MVSFSFGLTKHVLDLGPLSSKLGGILFELMLHIQLLGNLGRLYPIVQLLWVVDSRLPASIRVAG